MKAVLSMTFALVSLISCARFEIEKIHSRCIEMKQPISIDAVYASFNNGELLEKTDSGNSIHFFSPHPEYSEFYGSFIVAEADVTGAVISLKCSETAYAF